MPSNNITIKVVDWSKAKSDLSNIRRLVFIEEQNVPEEMEWDEFDKTSTHFLVTLNDQPIACARLKADGQIGRMAVLPEYRNQGFGSKLLQFVLAEANTQKSYHVYIHAQISAVPFYEKLGFITRGDIFHEANIPHREMYKELLNNNHG